MRNIIKKKKLKTVFAFCLGLVLSATGVYAATQINAEDVSFSEEIMKATNVQDAIDEIYNYDTTTNSCPENHKCLAKICKRATTLHTEECTQNAACSDAGYTISGSKKTTTITYGNLGTKGILTTGDAFDCDVNGDGVYDSTNERFYYVSPYFNLKFDSSYATLIYYKNTSDGVNYTTTATSKTLPFELVNNSIMSHTWSGVSLKNSKRYILDEEGNKTDDYSPYDYDVFQDRTPVTRPLTFQEIAKNCLLNTDTDNKNLASTCEFLLENTIFSNQIYKSRYGYWLETVEATAYNNATRAWIVNGSNRNLGLRPAYVDPNDKESVSANPFVYGYRPAIEVSLNQIEY